MSMPTTTPPSALQAEGAAADGSRVLFGVGGLVATALGLFVLFAPKTTAGAALLLVAALIGIYAVVTGLVYLGTAIFAKGVGTWSRVGHIALGLLYVVGGVIIMSNLLFAGVVTAILFSIMLGIMWFLEGILAFALAPKSGNKVWSIVYGIISVLAGATLMFSPLLGAVTIWWLLGISMVVLGVAQMVRAFRANSQG